MNLGIYLKLMADTEQLNNISKFVDENVNNKDIHDLSIFYDEVAFNPNNTRCGMFNSADLWSFNGNLIVTSFDALVTSLKIVNNINIFYYHGWDNRINVLGLAQIIQNGVQVISRSEHDSKYLYRVTGHHPIGISQNYENIVNILLRYKDEYKSNNNNVYQTA